MKSSQLSWVALAFVVACACGSGQKPAEPPPAATSTPEAPEPVAEKPAEPPKEDPAPEPDEPKPDEPRDVKYIVTGAKIEIEVAGCRFKPVAKAIRVGDGWGIKLTLEGEARDDKMHAILQTKKGPMAFAGKIDRKGKSEDIDDQREGGEDAFLTPGNPMKFERDWPGQGGGKPLKAGDKIELQVALWGLSPNPDPAARRLVRKFMRVSMSVGKGEPRALISAPE